MYEFLSRVRYSEVDANGNIRLSALVNYLQDCSSFQSEDLGIGIDYLAESKRTWVLNYWQVDILKYPRLTDNIIIGTIPYEIKSFVGYRNFYVKNRDTDEILVKANTIWTYLDTEKMRPARVDDIMKEKYAMGNKLDMEYIDHKIIIDGDKMQDEPILVTKHMIDTNNHVNNAKYIDMALGYLGDKQMPVRLRTEYKNAAVLGDILVPSIYKKDDEVYVIFSSEDERIVYAICQFVLK